MAVPFKEPACLSVTEPSQVGEARRVATALAATLDFDETRRGQVAIVASEAANNVLRHGRGGEVLLRPLRPDPFDPSPAAPAGLELIALDRGPGIANVPLALRDGYSTGGTPGTGLGAVRRFSSEFDLYSAPGAGTVLLSRLWPAAAKAPAFEAGAVCLPMFGEEACGDGWAAHRRGGTLFVIVADGLGHGLLAADASRLALRVFAEDLAAHPTRDLSQRLNDLHAALRPTRGAAVALLQLHIDSGAVQFVGVGNIAASLLPSIGTAQHLISHNGTVGAQLRRVQAFAYQWPAGGLLVMHSDGLGTQWSLDKYPGLRQKHPAVIAAVLYRDFRRTRDDVTVLAVRRGGAP